MRLIAGSLFRVDPDTLAIVEDLFPAITAQLCKACIGAEEISAVEVLVEQNLLVLDVLTHATPTRGRLLPPRRFLNATTLAALAPVVAPVVQPTCNRRAILQPQLDRHVYRHQTYASTFLFHTWCVETTAGTLLRTVEGLTVPFINPTTQQAYAGNWVLALPTLQPVGRMPPLTCIFGYDAVRGLSYAQLQQELSD